MVEALAAPDPERPSRLQGCEERLDQRGFAESCLPCDEEELADPRQGRGQRAVQRIQFARTPGEQRSRSGGRRVRGCKGHRGEMANKAVPAPIHRLDKAGGPGVIAQRLPQLPDTDGQHDLAHHRLRPEGLQQGRLGEELARVRHQRAQQGEGFGP
jgi:hypothetical protein